MKTAFIIASCFFAGLTLPPSSAFADTFTDSTGENFTTDGGGILDISSVNLTHTATDLIFKINLTGNPVATDWGKYMIGIDSIGGGDSAGNGWSRPITMPGMDFWIGTWVDSGNGAEVRAFSGTWGLQSATYGSNPDGISIFKDSSSVTIQLKYAGLGLSSGSSFVFDLYASGGGGSDSAIDALANPSQTISGWNVPYNSALTKSYTITPVPEPAAVGVFALAGGLLLTRTFRRRS